MFQHFFKLRVEIVNVATKKPRNQETKKPRALKPLKPRNQEPRKNTNQETLKPVYFQVGESCYPLVTTGKADTDKRKADTEQFKCS